MGRAIPVPTETKRTLAVFDFDGTITKYDTLLYFIYFAFKFSTLAINSIKILPTMLMFKLKLMANHVAKEKLFKTFFKGISVEKMNELSQNFKPVIDRILNVKALEKIQWHKDMGHEVIIVSASPENWIKPWASKNNINVVLSTKLEEKDNLITGSFLSKNCYGAEKVNRLLEAYPDRKDYILYAYGDSNGDKELLSLADYSFYKRF